MQNPGDGAPDGDMLPEYDFSHAEVGKYAKRYAAGASPISRKHGDPPHEGEGPREPPEATPDGAEPGP